MSQAILRSSLCTQSKSSFANYCCTKSNSPQIHQQAMYLSSASPLSPEVFRELPDCVSERLFNSKLNKTNYISSPASARSPTNLSRSNSNASSSLSSVRSLRSNSSISSYARSNYSLGRSSTSSMSSTPTSESSAASLTKNSAAPVATATATVAEDASIPRTSSFTASASTSTSTSTATSPLESKTPISLELFEKLNALTNKYNASVSNILSDFINYKNHQSRQLQLSFRDLKFLDDALRLQTQ